MSDESRTPQVAERAASQRRVDAVNAMIELWNKGRRDAAMLPEYLDGAIELESPFSSLVGEAYRGYEGILQWMRDIDEQFEEWSIAVDDVRQQGGRAVSLATISARGRASEVSLQFPAAAVFDFNSDARVTRIRIYLEVADALRAVGLEV